MRRTMTAMAGLAAVIAILSVGAGAQPVPEGRIFYAPLDGSLDAVSARGDKHGTAEGKPAFVDGRSGRGLEVGDVGGAAAVSYASAGNFNVARGTIALWMKPVNWRGDDDQYHLIFNVGLGGGTFLLYKNHNKSWGLTFFVDPGASPRNKIYCYQPIADWKPGQWHHIAFAWTTREGIAIYIGGKQVKYLGGAWMPDSPVAPKMQFGSSWQHTGDKTVIDDVMIFDRMLAPHEIAALAGKPEPAPEAMTPRDIPGVAMAHAILGQKVLAQIYRDALGDTHIDRARLSLAAEHDGKPVAQTTANLKQTRSELALDLTPLPLGLYEARVELLDGDTIRGVETMTVSKETNDTWATAAKLGKEDTVLPPFTPLETAGDHVCCWGRDYQFAGSGLPQQIMSRQAALLAQPVHIVAEDDRGALNLTPGKLHIDHTSPTEDDFVGESRAAALQVTAKVAARYDGTVWTALTFQPASRLDCRRLRVEIPIPAAQARYLYYIAPTRVDDKRGGYDALPAGTSAVWHREFLPSLWLGTEDRGLGWYAESDEHWDSDGAEALTIERRGGTVVLCMNIIRHSRQITKAFTIAFGLQATPVRPLPPDWRSYQWVPSTDITRFFLHLRTNPYPRPELTGQQPRGKVCYIYAYHPYFSNTLPKDPGEFREMLNRAKGYGLLCTPYTDTTFCPENAGDFWMHGAEMVMTPGARGETYGPVSNIALCHKGLWGDWFVWYVSHLIRTYGTNGIYLDDMWPYGCSNPEHGCGYVGSDGKRHITYPLRARYETYRRLRELFAATGKPFWITDHISGGRVPPLPTFGDCLLIGEDLYSAVAKNPDYTTNTTADQWRAGYSPEAWGIPIVVIPEFKMRGDWMRDPGLAATFMDAIVPHDLMAWPLFADTATIMQVRDALTGFGIGAADTTFLPYWCNGQGIACADSRVKLSAYLRPGKLLLCIANWSAADIAELKVKVDPAALHLTPPLVAADAVTGQTVPVHDTEITASVPAKRLRLIIIKAK